MAVSSMRKCVCPAERAPWEPSNNLERQMPQQASLRPQMLYAGQTAPLGEDDGVCAATSKDIRCLVLLNGNIKAST